MERNRTYFVSDVHLGLQVADPAAAETSNLPPRLRTAISCWGVNFSAMAVHLLFANYIIFLHNLKNYIIKHYIFQEKRTDSANCSRLCKKAADNVNYL